MVSESDRELLRTSGYPHLADQSEATIRAYFAKPLLSLNERLTTPAGQGVIIGNFPHDCQDDDIEDCGSGMRCKVCDTWVDNPYA